MQPLAARDSIELLDLRGNPLSNRTHEAFIAPLGTGLLDDSATAHVNEGLFFDADSAPILHTPVPTSGGPSNQSVTVSLANVADNAAGWLKSYGTTGYDYITQMVTDGVGNLYFAAVVDFTTGATPKGDIYLAKFTPLGQMVWSKTIGSSANSDRVTHLATDSAGSLYVVGLLGAAGASFDGGQTILPYIGGVNDIFVAKFGPTGTLEWVQTIGGTGEELPTHLFFDHAERLYVVGLVSGPTANFNSAGTLQSTLAVPGAYAVFVEQLSTAGAQMWMRGGGGGTFNTATAALNSLVEVSKAVQAGVDGLDRFYIAAPFFGAGRTFAGQTLTPVSLTDIFLVSMDANGIIRWKHTAGSVGDDLVTDIGFSPTNDLYLTGFMTGATSLTWNLLEATATAVSGQSDATIFVTKYNANGVFQWSRPTGSLDLAVGETVDLNPFDLNPFDVTALIRVDSTGNVDVAGVFGGLTNLSFGLNQPLAWKGGVDVFVAQFDAAGNRVWVKSGGSSGFDSVTKLLLDAANNVYVIGLVGGDVLVGDVVAAFENQTVHGRGLGDIVLLKYAPNGTLSWARGGGSGGRDVVSDLALDNAGGLYVTGLANFLFSFPGSDIVFDDTTRLEGLEGASILLLKYDTTTGALQWIKVGGSIVRNGIGPETATLFSAMPRLDLRGANLYVGSNFLGNVSEAYGVTFDRVTLAGVGSSGQASDLFFGRFPISGAEIAPVVFRATTSDPRVDAFVTGDDLFLVPEPGFTGSVQVRLVAYDGPSYFGDFRGRSAEQVFAVNIGTGSAEGIKFDDANGNGVRDAGESAIEGWPMYVDANRNGQFDAGEPTTVSDAQGRYLFLGLPAGQDHIVAELLPAAWIQTLGGPVALFSVLYDLFPGATGSEIVSKLVPFNGALYFGANGNDSAGNELWRFDGTSATRVTDINPTGSSLPAELIVFQGALYFTADDGVIGRELYKYDGVTASLVVDLGGAGGVWGVRPADGKIVKIDPRTGVVIFAFAAPGNLLPTHTRIGLSMAEQGGALLYVNADDNPALLFRLNPLTGSVLSTETIPSSALYDGVSAQSFAVVGTGQATLDGTNLDLGINADSSFILANSSLGARFQGVEFLTPGQPQASWSVAIAGTNFQNNSPAGPSAVTMTDTTFAIDNLRLFRGVGTVSTLSITRDIQFDLTQNFATIGIKLTNTGAASLTNVAWLENLDPDQGFGLAGWPNSTSTRNDVLPGGRYVQAEVTGTNFPAGLTVALGSYDARAVASVELLLNIANPFDVINSAVDPNNTIADSSINLAFNVGTLAAGQSTTITYFLIFGTTAAAQAQFNALNASVVTVEPTLAYLSQRDTTLIRQQGLSNPSVTTWTSGLPHGGLGGDATGRQFGFFADGFIHEFDPLNATAAFLSTLPAPAADIEGMAFDGSSLFVSTASGKLFTLNPSTGAIIRQVNVAGGALFGLGALANSAGGAAPEKLTVFNNALFFTDDADGTGRELWRYDGSSVLRLSDINLGAASSTPADLAAFQSRLYFSADDGVNGRQLWNFNPTNSQFTRITSLAANLDPRGMTVFNDKLFFSANGSPAAVGRELHSFDGANIALVADLTPVGASDQLGPQNFALFNGALYFSDSTSNAIGRELWKFDGATATLAADIFTGSGSSSPQALAAVGGFLYFSADDGVAGVEMWRYDGAKASRVLNVAPGAGPSNPKFFTLFDGKLYFVAFTPDAGIELREARPRLGAYEAIAIGAGQAVSGFDFGNLEAVHINSEVGGLAVTGPINEGATVYLSATIPAAAGLGAVTFLWQITDQLGQPITIAGPNDPGVSFTPADNGSFTVTLAVTSASSAAVFTATRVLFVANVAPSVSIDGGSTFGEGSNIALTSSESDPSPVDTHAYLWHVTASNGQIISDGTSASFNFTPNDNGSYLVSLKVTDDDGGATTVQKLISVTNGAPSASFAAPANVPEGSLVQLAAVDTDPGSADTHSYLWQVAASNGQVIGDGTAASFSFIPNDNGIYTVTLTVTDDDNGVGSAQAVINANNVAPAMALVGAAAADEGAPFLLDLGSIVDPGVDVITQIIINWGDSQSDTVTTFDGIAHTYLNGNNSTVTIAVTLVDDDGTHSAAGTLPVIVRNVAPAVALGPDFTVLEGELVNLSALVTDQGAETGFTYLWHVTNANGQVIPEGTAATFSFTPLAHGIYTVTLNVHDDAGVGTDTLRVTVQNVNPILELGADRAVNEGSTVNFNGPALISDPGTLDVFIYNWVVTDSSGGVAATGAAANFNFVPADDGIFTVALTITDAGDPTSQAADTVLVTAVNVAPAIGLSGAPNVNEGSPYELTLGPIVEPGTDTISQIIIDWGDGSTDTIFAIAPVAHSFANGNASRVIRVDLVDEDGRFNAAGSKTVNVVNVLPSFDLGPALNVAEGAVVLLAPAVIDPGAETLTYSWQVSLAGATVATSTTSSLLFTPTDNGAYTISLAVTDDTGTTSDSVLLNAVNAAPVAAIGTSGLIEGSLATFTAQVADPGSADTHTYQWELRDGLTSRPIEPLATTPSEGFGNSVAISGNLMIIGAYLTDLHGTNSGAAYLFERSASGLWQQIARLAPDDGAANDWFGFSVAISGNLAVIGALFDDSAAGNDAGSAYVFERNANNLLQWTQVAKLVAADAQGDDHFGYSVAVSGDTVIVGAWQEDGASDASPEAGAAYVFERNLGGANAWGQAKKLTATTPVSGDRLGSAVALDGDIAVVGAPFADDAGNDAGAAYIFERNQGGVNQWGFVKQLRPIADAGESNAVGDNFGVAVSLSGARVLVGAPGDEQGNNIDASIDLGSAYLFERDRGGVANYGVVSKLQASDRGRGDRFGSSVALSGDRLVVGARTAAQGTAYLFEQHANNLDQWTELERLAPPSQDDHFGWSVAISSGRALVGANFNLVAGREDAQEKVYLFEGLTRILTGSAATLQFTSIENAAFRVSLLVTDDDGATGAATRNVVVVNAAPQQVSGGPNRTVNEGQPVNLNASFIDPGVTDTQTIAWRVSASNGQVIPDGAGSNFSFTPVDDGTYVVTLTITDDDGGVGTGTTVVTVNNVAPQQVNAGPDLTVNEGQSVNLTGTFTDPGVNDGHGRLWQVSASNGQFVPSGTGATFSFTPANNGVYTVTFTVTDDDGGVGSDSVVITVNNVMPLLALGATNSVNGTLPLGEIFDQQITITDPGAENSTASIDFGDGSAPVNLPAADLADDDFTITHFYATAGAKPVTVSVNDGTATSTINFTVTVMENRAPTIDPGTDQTIPEGQLFTLAILGHDLDVPAQTLTYSLEGTIPSGASINSNTGLLSWQPSEAQGPGTYNLTVRVSDGDLFAEQSWQITVTEVNDVPAIGAISPKTVEEEHSLQFVAPVTDVDIPAQALQFALLNAPAGMTVSSAGLVSWTPDATQGRVATYIVTLNVSDGLATSSQDFSVTVTDPLLIVSGVQPTPSGFTINFNRPINSTPLSLYSTETGGQGPADVTLVGATVGTVRGSLVVEDNGKALAFIKTGDALLPDNYTITLRSAANGLIDHNGLMLDGNGDGIAGGDFVQSLTIASSTAVVVRLPDFARGAGQSVNVPATGSGIPITLSNGAGVQSVDLVLKYNPTLLTITGVALGSGLPAGSVVEANLSFAGEVHIAIAALTPLGAGGAELVRLIAQVPATAAYRGTHILDIASVSINEGAITAIGDDAIHVAAHIGDTSGNGPYSALDAQRTLRVAAGLDSGFVSYLKIDPVLIGDVSGNGVLSSLDGTRILQEVVGIDQTAIPPLAGIVIPPPVADPLVNMPTDITGTPGSTVTVPVKIDNADLLETVVLKIAYDTELLDVAADGVRTGALAAGGSLLANVDEAAGVIFISLLTQPALTAGAGTLLEIDFQIRSDAVAGATPIDLQSLSLNEGQLILTIDPVVGADGTDGRVTIASAAVIDSESAGKIDAQPIDIAPPTVIQSPAPVASASDRFATLFDLDRSRINGGRSRSRVTFDTSSIGLRDFNDLHDSDWLSAAEIHKRIVGFTQRKASKIQVTSR
jgi:ELWxxDGT repeat protein